MKKILTLICTILLAFVLISCKNNNDLNKDKQTEKVIDDYLNSIVIETTITDKIDLPKDPNIDGALLSWFSSNTLILSDAGVVIVKPDNDTSITLRANLSLKGITKSRIFECTVIGLNSVVFDELNFFNPYGYASLTITNRINKPVIQVNNEIEFLDALANKNNKIIEITSNLNMGYNNVVKLLQASGKTVEQINEYTSGSYYRQNQNIPLLHPILIKEGVGQLIIQNRTDGLMIYSKTGIEIKHLTIQIKTSKDIVFRNLHLKDIWEWDELDNGNYKLNDWDYFTIETTDGVWLDHLKLEQAYDGIVDIKQNVKNVTFSWLDLTFVPNDFILAQFEYLELHRSELDYYNEMRSLPSVSYEELIRATSAQKKGFNLGNSTDGIGYEDITVTFHHIYAKNLLDRLPRVRKGDIHLYNIISDSSDMIPLKAKGLSIVNQGIVSTEGGAVLMEKSRFIGIIEPIKTHQENILDPKYTGRYKVVDSEYIYQFSYYRGGSNVFGSPWTSSNTNVATQPFYFRNYQYVPYRYNTVEPDVLSKLFEDYKVGTINETFDLLDINKALGSIKIVDGHKLDGSKIVIDDSLIDLSNPVFIPKDPIVYNYYGGKRLIKDTDYSLTIDQSSLILDLEGTYNVKYTFKSLVNEDDIVVITQQIVVYDSNKGNEIYYYSINNEFDGKIDLSYKVYAGAGTLYYFLSNTDNIEDVNDFDGEIKEIELTKKADVLNNIESTGYKYLYAYTVFEGTQSKLIELTINSETIVHIKTLNDFYSAITNTNNGIYYILDNDLDFTNKEQEYPYLNSNNEFKNILDGNNHTLKNLTITRTKGGMIYSLTNGIIRNLIYDNINITVSDVAYYENGELITSSAGDDAGIVATYTYGNSRIENITIKNSSVNTPNKNYAGAIIGRVRTGVAYVNQIIVNNVNINVNGGKYTGGLIGGAEADTTLYMTDIYINNLAIVQLMETDMIGILVGRIRSIAHFERIVIDQSSIKGFHNIGIIAGKEDTTVTLTTVKDVIAVVDIFVSSDAYIGYITGNSGAGNKFVVENFTAKTTNVGSKGTNEPVNVVNDLVITKQYILTQIDDLTEESFLIKALG
jgi:pectate lyase